MLRPAHLLCLFILAAIVIPRAETVTAVSDTFSFPEITAVKNIRKNVKTPTFFSCLGTSSRSNGTVFAWSFPSQPLHEKGNITIYSPLGRAVKVISVTSNRGYVSWKGAGERSMGVYIARINYGTGKQNLKFFLSK
jgi:hypothetical protein